MQKTLRTKSVKLEETLEEIRERRKEGRKMAMDI
jgi:hypothetical protein